jgi:DNA-binding CsgD family transcriptional regulator
VLVGRERELAELRRGLRDRAPLLVIEGAAGIGKTSLLEVAARASDARVLVARAGELERELPFGVIRQLLEPVLTPAQLTGAAELAAPVLDPHPTRDAPPAFAVLHGLYWALAGLAETQPLLLAIDDLHWADAPSLRALAYVLSRLEGVDAQVCVALRPHEPDADEQLIEAVLRAAPSRVIRPGPLSVAAVAAMMNGADPEFVSACHTAAGGNPLLLAVHLRALAEAGVEPVAAAAPRVGDVVPDGLAAAVRRRLERLGADATAAARAVAVLGDDADPGHVAALAGGDASRSSVAGRPGDALDALQRVGLLARARPAAFAHPLVRAAVVAGVPAAELARLHREAARALVGSAAEPERPAAHLLEVDPAGEQWVVDALTAAADSTAARGAPETAARLLRRALAEPPAPERRHALLLSAGGAEAQAGDPRAIAHLREAADAASDGEARVRAIVALTNVMGVSGDVRGGIAVLQRELEREQRGDLRLQLEAELIQMAGLDVATRPLAVEVLDRLPKHLGADRIGCILSANLATEAVSRGESRAEARELAERALAGGRLLDLPFHYAHAASALMLAGYFGAALAAWDDYIAYATRRGDSMSVAWGHAFRAGVQWRAGALSEALGDAELAAEVGTGGLPPRFALVYGVEARLLRGELDAARDALALAPVGGRQVHDALLLAARGRLHLAQGRARQALEELREVERVLERWLGNATMAPWQDAAVEALVALGERDEAAALARRAVAQAERWGDPWLLGQALRAQALVAGGDIEPLERAVEILRGSEATLECARAQLALGSAVRDRERLAEALEIAERCAAPAIAEQARAELVKCGARPRRAARTGAAALTATEERVARMAAAGPSNREIAQALFVTEKTVEAHLSSAYRKLGIRARGELAAQLGV